MIRIPTGRFRKGKNSVLIFPMLDISVMASPIKAFRLPRFPPKIKVTNIPSNFRFDDFRF